jgi:cytochrome c biogenesis protein CcmG/thiol:disulfide interchange protein DsbE
VSRWLAALPLIVLIALGGLFGLYALHRNPQVQPQALVGKPAPALSLPTLAEGAPTSVPQAAAAGPIIVNFFASWCAPCEIENPVLMTLKGQKVRVVGVAYKDAPQNTQGFLNRLGDPYSEVLVDRDGRAGVEFGVTGVPETYVVAADGKVLAKHTGPLTQADAARLAAMTR